MVTRFLEMGCPGIYSKCIFCLHLVNRGCAADKQMCLCADNCSTIDSNCPVKMKVNECRFLYCRLVQRYTHYCLLLFTPTYCIYCVIEFVFGKSRNCTVNVTTASLHRPMVHFRCNNSFYAKISPERTGSKRL